MNTRVLKKTKQNCVYFCYLFTLNMFCFVQLVKLIQIQFKIDIIMFVFTLYHFFVYYCLI